MPLTDHIYDQRLNLRRAPQEPPRRPLLPFKVHLSDRSVHDVLASTSEDAELHVKRRNPRKHVLSTERVAP